jgi:hypothetical protein
VATKVKVDFVKFLGILQKISCNIHHIVAEVIAEWSQNYYWRFFIVFSENFNQNHEISPTVITEFHQI